MSSSIYHKGRLSADNGMSQEAPHNSVVVEVSGSGSSILIIVLASTIYHVAFHAFQNSSLLPFVRGHARTYFTELL